MALSNAPVMVLLMRALAVLMLLACLGCGSSDPEAGKTVAVIAIPMPDPTERNALVDMARGEAAAYGLKLYSYTPQQLRQMDSGGPGSAGSVSAAIWLENEPIVSISDQNEIGHVEIVFWKGKDPQKAERFRKRLVALVARHWPTAVTLPLSPSGEPVRPRA